MGMSIQAKHFDIPWISGGSIIVYSICNPFPQSHELVFEFMGHSIFLFAYMHHDESSWFFGYEERFYHVNVGYWTY